jgi:hypothetical protein
MAKEFFRNRVGLRLQVEIRKARDAAKEGFRTPTASAAHGPVDP